MQHPIPSPRRSDHFRPVPPLPRRTPLIGPVCPVCEHPSCRTRRAQRLPRLGGHRAEYAHPSPTTTLNGRLRRSFFAEHAQAAAIQARHRRLLIWWGEATQSFWVATPTGLVEAADADALLLALWPHTDPPTARPWARTASAPRVPALV